MDITTKYSVGDTVFVGRSQWGSKPVTCPDCKGTGKWKIVANDGPNGSWNVTCQTCRNWGAGSGYGTGKVKESTRVAVTEQRTIGSVQINTHEDCHDSGVRYMCMETGVGSGQIYPEKALFATREEAQAYADAQVAEQLPEARNEDERIRDRLRRDEAHHCTRRSSATKKLEVETEKRAPKKWAAWVPGIEAVEDRPTEAKALKALASKLAERVA